MKFDEYKKKLEKNQDFINARKSLKLNFDLGNAVLDARIKKGLSQNQLAEFVGTKQANISRIETGLANPTLSMIQKLKEALDLSINICSTEPKMTKIIYYVDQGDKIANPKIDSEKLIQIDNCIPVYSFESNSTTWID